VIEEINNRPRKILGYQTPNEVFNNLVRKEVGVAINY
jgi:IS30 family transposase